MRGSLEDLALSDILHIVFLSKRTGILALMSPGVKGSLLFKNGRVVSVRVEGDDTSLGDILVREGLVPRAQLDQILRAGDGRALRVRLLEFGLPDDQMEQAARRHVVGVLRGLCALHKGTFAFDLIQDLPTHAGVTGDVLLRGGIEPDDVLDAEEGASSLTAMPFKIQHEDVVTGSPVKTAGHHAVVADSGRVATPSVAPRAPEIPKAPAPSRRAPVPEPDGPPVILVDDEELFRVHIEGVLMQQGCRVYAYDSAKDALAACRRLHESGEAPIVVSDLLMRSPKGDSVLGGLALLEEVRKMDDAIPVLLMTAHPDGKARHEAYRLGVNNYLLKPDVSRVDISRVEEDLQQFSEDIHHIVSRLARERKRLAVSRAAEAPPPTSRPADDVTEATFSQAASPSENQLRAIRALVTELQNPSETTEISLLILRLAAEFFDRAVLFLVKEDKVTGLGGFGETGDKENINEKVRRIHIGRNDDSVFGKVVETRQTHRGKLKDTMHNRLLIDSLGKLVPREVVVVPLVSRRRVITLLYGDNALHRKPIGNIEGLEIFMSQAGIAMENAMLHRRLSGGERTRAAAARQGDAAP